MSLDKDKLIADLLQDSNFMLSLIQDLPCTCATVKGNTKTIELECHRCYIIREHSQHLQEHALTLVPDNDKLD